MATTFQKSRDDSANPVRFMLVEAEPEKKRTWKSKKGTTVNVANFIKFEPKSDLKKGRGKYSGKRNPKQTNFSAQRSMKPYTSADTGISYYEMPDEESRKLASEYAVKQIEYFFSTHNLCSDVYLRSYMDCEGYIPIAFVANFPGVAMYGAEFEDILDGIRTSEVLDIDEVNETMRLKENWHVWLLPNTSGSWGVSRYIKVDNPPSNVEDYELGVEEGDGSNQYSDSQHEESTTDSADGSPIIIGHS